MKGTRGAKRTPNEAVIVVFKPRIKSLPARSNAAEAA